MNGNENKPRVVWFNIDALRPDIFYDLLDSNKLPNFGRIFGRSRRAERAASVFPTVTMTCQASLATGAFPGRHLIIGNGWFDRYGKKPSYR
ncbi:MAG: alkaline phosphatase family protein, partial [bacterium]